MDQKLPVIGLVLGATIAGYVLWPSIFGSSKIALKKYPTGLVNSGNDCYANSTFQALASLTKLSEWLRRQTSDQGGSTTSQTADAQTNDNRIATKKLWTIALCDVLSQIRRESNLPHSISIWPLLHVLESVLRNRLSRNQQDAHEMLVYALDQLKMENSNYLPLEVKLVDTIKCFKCGFVRTNHHKTLVLEIQPTDPIMAPRSEIISGYRCENCNQLTNIEKRTSTPQLSEILVVHVNRSTAFGGQMFRNNCDTSITLALGAYKLQAIVFHRGGHSQGHYTCARRKVSSRKLSHSWWLISDTDISEISDNQLRALRRDAYLLFFELDDQSKLCDLDLLPQNFRATSDVQQIMNDNELRKDKL